MALLGTGLSQRGALVEFLLCGRENGPAALPPGTAARTLPRQGALQARLRLVAGGASGVLLPGVLSGRVGVLSALESYLRTVRPQALIAAAVTPNLLAVHARQRAAVPTRVILTVHNTLSAQLCDLNRTVSLKHYTKRFVLPGLLRRACLAADSVVAVSDGVADDFARTTGLARRRIHTVYNPVFTPELAALAAAPPAHAWLAETAVPVVIAAGRLVPQKNFARLLRAFAQLRAQRPARLVLLGEGQERPALEALARELGIAPDVALPGFVANPYACFARAAVCVLSSDHEGLPTVLIEALACGCPVVATDCPHGPAEILESGRYGHLVPMNDLDALAQAMEQTLAAPPDRAVLRARGRDFSVARAADRYLSLIGWSLL